MSHKPHRHRWSPWGECVSPKFEYRVCYSCLKKQVEEVTKPPRWVQDHAPTKKVTP